MSKKRHKINKFANYQTRVRNSPALDRYVVVLSQTGDVWFLT